MGLASERHVVAELGRLRRSSMWPDRLAPPGEGRAAVLVNGFGVPPATLSPLARWLRAGGWAVEVAPIGWNVGCGEVAVQRLDAVIETVGRGAPVALLGHSRGGVLARVAAVRLPQAVTDLVTICTPWAIGPPDRPGVALSAGLVRHLRRRGVDVMASVECATGPCCEQLRADMEGTPRATWTAIWSSRDGVVSGSDPTPPAEADHAVDIETTHLGGVASVPAWTAIAAALTPSG